MAAGATDKRILFVCAGNLCRSFMAERIFRKQLSRRALRNVQAESAGLLDLDGADADPQAVELLREKGFDDSMHRSRVLTKDLVAHSDLIVVMERDQMEEISRRYPDAVGKVRLLKSFSSNAGHADLDIEDPRGRSSYHYRTCFTYIYFSLEGLLQCI
jgi:protein-tyrosine phosphatase